MNPITLTVEIDDSRHLNIDLPPDTPTGTATLVITPQQAEEQQQAAEATQSATEIVRAKLRAAGLLATHIHAPEGTVDVDPQEILRLGTMRPGAPTSDELMKEDRGDY
jgi:hypothetical protein